MPDSCAANAAAPFSSTFLLSGTDGLYGIICELARFHNNISSTVYLQNTKIEKFVKDLITKSWHVCL